jgi:hypothetical protein
MAASSGSAFTTTMRVIDWVHCNTANGRANTAPTRRTRFTYFAQIVFAVADFTDCGATLKVNAANLTGT